MKRSTLAAAAILLGLAGNALAQTVVRPGIGFDPYLNVGDPFSNLTGAMCAPPFSTLQFRPGVFREARTFSTPITLTGSAGGSTVIGSLGTQSTTLKVMSYNTHLFGLFPLPVWQDTDRALAMGIYFSARYIANDVDVVGLQEVWSGTSANQLLSNSVIPFHVNGDDREGASTLGSGTAFMSRFPIFGFSQHFFDAERGDDANSSKGWIQMTIVKDGFSIGVFNTHLQAGEGADNEDTRDSQLYQMANAIWAYRLLNPSHPVIVMGDFNIAAGSSEYQNLRFKMGFNAASGESSQFGDIASNLGPCGGDYGECTSCGNNPVYQYFYGNSGGAGRIDFFFYNHSRDGTVTITPTQYDTRRPQSVNNISGSGWAPENCGTCSLTSTTLSDHDAIHAEFTLRRN